MVFADRTELDAPLFSRGRELKIEDSMRVFIRCQMLLVAAIGAFGSTDLAHAEGIDAGGPLDSDSLEQAQTQLGALRGEALGLSDGGPAVVRGSLPKEAIRSVIRDNRAQVRSCYEAELARSVNAAVVAGRVAIKFVITGEGFVETSDVAHTTVNAPQLEQCVSARVRTWTFPRPKGGGKVIVTYPFVFMQSK